MLLPRCLTFAINNFAFWLVPRKPLEMLELITEFEAVCIRKKYLEVLQWINKTFSDIWLDTKCTWQKNRNNRIEKTKLNIAMEVQHKVYVPFPETKDFINEKLKQKCSNENISVEVIYFSLTSLQARSYSKHFLLCSVGP